MQTTLKAKIKDIKLGKEEIVTLTLQSLDGDQLEILRQIKEGGTAHILFSSSQLDIDDYRPAVPQPPEGIKYNVNNDGTANVESKEDDGQLTIDEAAEQTEADQDDEDSNEVISDASQYDSDVAQDMENESDDPMAGVDDADPDEDEEEIDPDGDGDDDLPGLDTDDGPGF
ncbi:hypothetical protein [Paenibacillus methanolicus]|uniref:Uncharacterized protein n=1 Tax=Paenibacillus methanolicus TaxID=582686 RepID=A0A5S5BPJ9_9BACL|nr:hypothetical protein [Paenibacillus methanolicus]TYP68917.1 hypothetical protein BCM02_11735 [Paenibacillus methanolicus]